RRPRRSSRLDSGCPCPSPSGWGVSARGVPWQGRCGLARGKTRREQAGCSVTAAAGKPQTTHRSRAAHPRPLSRRSGGVRRAIRGRGAGGEPGGAGECRVGRYRRAEGAFSPPARRWGAVGLGHGGLGCMPWPVTRGRGAWCLGWAVAMVACRNAETVATPVPDAGGAAGPGVSAAASRTLPAAAEASPQATPPPGEPRPSAEPAAAEPAPEPPPRPTLPDGTPIEPCGEPPPGMACIPGGPFLRGTNDEEPTNARPQATVWLQTFYLDVHEVTYEQ